MPISSGSSDEIIMIVRPFCVSSLMILCISAFALTSTPRVGSSRIKSFGPIASALDTDTFCWLPPDRFATRKSGAGALIPTSLMYASPFALSFFSSRKPGPLLKFSSWGSDSVCHGILITVDVQLFSFQPDTAGRPAGEPAD